MKFDIKILEREKAYRNKIERARNELDEVARNSFSAAKGIVAEMNATWSEYIGKRVKITAIDSNSLFNIKKDGGKSKMRFHFPYYTEEIVEIEAAE